MARERQAAAGMELQTLLERTPSSPLLPECASASPTQLVAEKLGASLLAWSREAGSRVEIPETTYTLYRGFRMSGERQPYEKPYFDKRGLLTREVLAAWLGQDDSRMGRINDLIWSICEETTWVLPAHEHDASYIDLFAAETGVELAHVLFVLGDRLPKEVRERVRAEIRRRIFEPYLEHGTQYSWGSGRNNWTGVCAGSIGQTFLMLEDDPARQAQALSLVLEQLERFIHNAFEEDGGCLEGMSYWNYGLIHYVAFAEMLRERTRGAMDLLAQDKIKAIARYPLAVYLGKDTYASFSDAHEHSSVEPFLAARLAERTGAVGLRGLVGGATGWRLSSVLRNLLWRNGKTDAAPPLEDVFLPKSGIARLVGETSGRTLAVVIKAGHNGEPHNHNDIGSFVLAVDGTVYLCDPGAGLYSAAYFSSKRYENIFANSYGHSVPRIGGTLQAPGREHCGVMEKSGDQTVCIGFEKAYAVDGLNKATRTISLHDGLVTLEDTFECSEPGLDVEEALVTWQVVATNGSTARIVTDNGTLEIRADQGPFKAERLEDACKANGKPGVLTRLSLTYARATGIRSRLTFAFHPAS